MFAPKNRYFNRGNLCVQPILQDAFFENVKPLLRTKPWCEVDGSIKEDLINSVESAMSLNKYHALPRSKIAKRVKVYTLNGVFYIYVWCEIPF